MSSPAAVDTTGANRRPPPLLLIFAITATGMMSNAFLSPVIPDIVKDFGAEDGIWNGLLVAGGSIAGIVVAPITGVLADRRGRRSVLVTCLLIFGIFGTLASQAPSLPVLFVARLAQGIGSAGLINLAVVLISDNWSGSARARIIGWNSAVITVSIILFPAAGGFIGEHLGWRWVFAVYSTAFATAAAVMLNLRKDIRPEVVGDAADTFRRAAKVATRRPLVLYISLGAVVFLAIFGLLLVSLPSLLESDFDLSASRRGLMAAVPAFGATTTALTIGPLRRQFSVDTLVLTGLALLAVAFVAVGLAPGLVVLAIALIVYGLAEGLLIPTLQDVVAEESPEDIRGTVFALWVGAVRAGQTAGPLLIGLALANVAATTTFLIGGALFGALTAGVSLARYRSAPPHPVGSDAV